MLHGLVSMESCSYNGVDMTMLERQQARSKLQGSYMDQNDNSIELCSSSVPQFQGFNERCLGSGDFHKFVNFSVAGQDFDGGKMNMSPQEVAADITMESPTCRKSFNKRKAEDVVDDKRKDKRIKGEMEMEDVSRNSSMENSKALEVQKQDYIHVRARRGQATDSHSLAERARREKISKKMKCLQDLVPGCNKVTGKAGMLDEIINYVQSLQKQVEFLSMKLAAQNPTSEFNVENLPMKDISVCLVNFPAAFKTPAMGSLAFLQLNALQKEAVNSMLNATMNHPETETEGVANASLSIPEQALNSSCINQLQPFSTWNTDPIGLQNVYNMGFH